VIDGDGIEGNYDLAAGDRPRIYGSQTAFWVMNDVGNEHVRSGSDPIGLEVQATAFTVSSPEAALDQATFYRFRLVNRNTLPLEDARLSMWVDTDMGLAVDEYEGVDTTRGLGYYYNAGETDEGYGIPPAAGFDFLGGGLGSFHYAVNAPSTPITDPETTVEFHRVQRGLWKDGTPITATGNGYDTNGPVTVWAFPGDPVEAECWSNINTCLGGVNVPGNHRIIPSSPTFSLQPGESRTFDLAHLFAQGESNLDSITELRAVSDAVQARYDDGSLFDTRLPVAAEDGATPTAARLDAVYPNPVRDRATVAFAVAEPGPVRLAVHDVLGRRARTLVEGPLAVGEHTAPFDTAALPNGMYLVVLEAEGQRQTRKVLVVR
jgi:hypothetical protein